MLQIADKELEGMFFKPGMIIVLFFSPIHGQEQIFHSSYLILFQISIFQVFSNFDIKWD